MEQSSYITSKELISLLNTRTARDIDNRLAPELLPELKKLANKAEKKAKLFQWLTDDVGHPKLREHLASIVTILKLSKTPQEFKDNVDRVHIRYGYTQIIPFDYPLD